MICIVYGLKFCDYMEGTAPYLSWTNYTCNIWFTIKSDLRKGECKFAINGLK